MKVDKHIRNRIYRVALTEFDNSVTVSKSLCIYTVCRGLCGCLRNATWTVCGKTNVEYPEVMKHEPKEYDLYWFPRKTQEDIDVRREILLIAIAETEPNVNKS